MYNFKNLEIQGLKSGIVLDLQGQKEHGIKVELFDGYSSKITQTENGIDYAVGDMYRILNMENFYNDDKTLKL